jgi:PAP2 superfamily protein
VSETTAPPITGVPEAPRSGLAERRLSDRNGRLLLLGVVLYVALLSALMIARGIAVTPDVLLVGLGLAAVVLGRGRLFLRDWIPFIALFFAYELMRGYADDLGASIHITDVIALERLFNLGVLPTQVLQQALHPATGTDPLAVAGTIFYFLHFPLPLAVGFLLWLKRRALYYDYVASLILLCLAGFATYLVLPVAPPWWAAEHGFLPGPNGAPAITYLKPEGFDALASLFGFSGQYIYTYTFYEIAPNPVAAFPSLHAAFPFLAFLFVRKAFGNRAGAILLTYFALLVFAIVYLADHYLVDAYAGVIYAVGAAWLVLHAPARLRAWLDRARDEGLEGAPAVSADSTALDGGTAGSSRPPVDATIQPLAALRRLPLDRTVVLQGLALVVAGAAGLAYVVSQGYGNAPVSLLPWALLLGGAWRAAAGVLVRR